MNISKKRVDDLELSSYGVLINEVGFKTVYNQKGIALKIYAPGPMHYQLEQKDIATKIDKPVDFTGLFKETVAMSDKVIKDAEKVLTLKLGIKTAQGVSFYDGPGQKVTKLKSNDYIIKIGQAFKKEATKQETTDNLKATKEFPSDRPEVISLALKAIGDTDKTEEKVSKLANFVAQYIEDAWIHRNQSALETIKIRKGDCTEHSELFVALARSIAIPARTVGGLNYVEGSKQFTGHMWCETVIDGNWEAVDPTFGEYPIKGLYVRFPTGQMQCYFNMKAIQNMKIEILDIGYGE